MERGSFPIRDRVYEAAGLQSSMVSEVLGNSILALETRAPGCEKRFGSHQVWEGTFS